MFAYIKLLPPDNNFDIVATSQIQKFRLPINTKKHYKVAYEHNFKKALIIFVEETEAALHEKINTERTKVPPAYLQISCTEESDFKTVIPKEKNNQKTIELTSILNKKLALKKQELLHHRSESDDDHDYHQPLCNCTTITRGEALMMTLLLGAEESLTWKTITAILSMINTLFKNEVVPASKHKLFKILELNEEILSYHLFCEDCLYYFGAQEKLNKEELVCETCRNNEKSPGISYFLTFDVSQQLKKILENPEVQEVLLERFQGVQQNLYNNDIRNMSDGQIYKKLSTINHPLADKYNFTYTFNTDGCQPSKSSKLSIWPIYVKINELPPKLQSKHIIMTGLWVHKKEPGMLLFLQPFVHQANKLSDEGIQWKLGDQLITSKFIPLCAVVDSVARCKVLNMKQYNGTHGCTFCEHPTERVDNNRKYPISIVAPPDRTDESIKRCMILAAQNEYGRDVMGVRGPSPLMNLKYFNIADGMSPDYMHAILLGVIKQHTEILLSSFGKDYYIGNPNQLEVISTKLQDFKHPTCITRSPRSITERDMWKASEWRSWLLFYCLLCLKGILPQKYLEHLALLVEAVCILLLEIIEYNDLEIAGSLIVRYVALYQEYFGKQVMTYNIHLLLHMKRCVLNLGPLQFHNTFIFENENHFVLKMQKSPNHIAVQIARRYLFQKSLPLLKKKIEVSDDFLKFCEKHLTGRLKNSLKVNNCILIGKEKDYELNPEEKKLLNKSAKCKSFNRFILNGKRYTSDSYRFCEKINDSSVLFKNGKIGIIKNICYFGTDETKKKIFIFFEEVIKQKKYFFSSKNVTVHNVEECLITKKFQYCEASMILQPRILTSIETKSYVIFIPPGCYGD
ncbi:uncharacterized protein LOC130664985 isoform X1 [Microplitis mediator]|uniref:uncharacterized protein LOC130664985 isoform X1 n=1 Tax=Microplitis mediator TaxID=375433 RepID=UPI002554F8CB|nr:uncharacterized protein LOC130664985 isoform X1 [Microplitis mediator]